MEPVAQKGLYQKNAHAFFVERPKNDMTKYIEEPSIFGLLGKLDNENIIDLGCGVGRYTSELRKRTRGAVYGVDVSPEMINIAKQHTLADGFEISYIIQDISIPFSLPIQFDVATLIWVIAHCSDYETIKKILENTYKLIKPGGKLVFFDRVLSTIKDIEVDKQYGAIYILPEGYNELKAHDKLFLKGTGSGTEIIYEDYVNTKEIIERAVKEAGFFQIEWHKPAVSSDWHGDAHYWDALVEHSVFGLFVARKQNENQ